MSTLWDLLPASARQGGALASLEPLLQAVPVPPPLAGTERTESDGTTWRIWTTSLGGTDPLAVDPATGQVSRGAPGAAAGSATLIEFPDPNVDVELGLRLDAPGGAPDGTVRVILTTPRAIVRLPFLRGAMLDATGMLRADPAHPAVRFHLPALRVQLLRPDGGALGVELLAASTGAGTPPDRLYEFTTMEPPYALIGPGDVVGFAFRTAVLDLSGTAGPGGVPAGARAMPGEWQGLYLPDARLFVAPSGLEGLAVSAGVRDFWIGIGAHAGVTGLVEAEVVNRGAAPQVRLRLRTPTGEFIGVADGTAPATVAAPPGSTLLVDAGGGLAPYTYTIQSPPGTTIASTDRATVNFPAGSTSREFSVRVRDGIGGETTRAVTVTPRATPAGAAPSGAPPVAVLPTGAASALRVERVASTATTVTLRALEPDGREATGTIAWSWSGGSASGATATVPVAAGATVTVTATRTRTAPVTIECYMLFDRPQASRMNGAYDVTVPLSARDPGGGYRYAALQRWATNPENVRAARAAERGAFGAAPPFLVTAGATTTLAPPIAAQLAAAGPSATWTVEGWASYEDGGDAEYNVDLSARRRNALAELLKYVGVDPSRLVLGTAHGFAPARAEPAEPASGWWRARATSGPVSTTDTATVRCSRVAIELPDPDPEPTRAPVPDCFRKIGVRVELVRGTFVRCEVYGEFDVHTAAEQRLGAASPGAVVPPRTNPLDGITRFLVRLRIAEDRSSWEVTAELRAADGDTDGLHRIDNTAADARGVNILGAVATLSPLLAAVTPPNPRAGELVPLGVGAAAAVAIGGANILRTRSLTLHGAELVITDGLVDPADGSGPRTTTVSLLLDVETRFAFDLAIIRVPDDRPVSARYKATGVRSTWHSRPRSDGVVEYVPLPVFDPARGYALDIPAGALVAQPPLDALLRIFGVRVSRDNPTYLEVELGIAVDLGIVTIETVRARLRLDQPELPQLTKLGASLEVPGTLHGKGYVELTAGGFKGAFDLTISPVNIRVSAVLAVETDPVRGVTGVLVGAEVQFPVPLPLGQSGLGIYGFMGGVGVNYARREEGLAEPRALRWLETQLARPGNVMDPQGWTLTPGAFAVAAGMLLGTVEGGFVLHLKGIVLIEVPGPRLLLVMQADVLKLPPVLDSAQSATFLAVLDLDIGRGTITIGIVAAYTIESLLRLRVPVTAFFNANAPQEWFVHIGSLAEPVTVQVLDVFTGTGYLMVQGNGLTHPALGVTTTGLTIAVGFHVSAVLMGSKAVGLYFEAAAGFDALVAFDPFFIAGRIVARGELRLWVVGIGASAELTVTVGRRPETPGPDGAPRYVETSRIHGRACGRVELLFFEIEGCVELVIGGDVIAPPAPSPLVAGVTLVSRSPALVEGTATDRAIDGALAEARAADDPRPLPVVPLDAIPVVQFAVPPAVAPGDVVLGGVAHGTPGLAADPWVRRGAGWWCYRVTSVTLEGALVPAAGGKTPATWWKLGDLSEPERGAALALLSWLPTPFPRAVPVGEQLTRTVTEQWGHVCAEVAPPTRVLWTFDGAPTGASPAGWTLAPVPWPDPPGTVRSVPVTAPLEVRERWRTGDGAADRVQGTEPARVVGDAVPCPDKRFEPVTRLEQWANGLPKGYGRTAALEGDDALRAAIALLADGRPLADVPATLVARAWDRDLSQGALACEGRILRSPVHDTEEPAPFGAPEDRELVARARAARAFTPSSLACSLLLRAAAGFVEVRLALLVDRSLVTALTCRFRDAAGAVLGDAAIDPGAFVSSSNPVPAPWTDGGGPWANPVERAGRMAARAAMERRSLLLAIAPLKPPAGTVEIEVGYRRDQLRRLLKDGVQLPFWLVAVEGLVASERRREAWDRTIVEEDRAALVQAVTQDPDDRALLAPGTTHTVRVAWEYQYVEGDARPGAPPDDAWQVPAGGAQAFRFATDPVTSPPPFLDPWLLCTAPAAGESAVLCAEPLRLALATQKVTDLFAAYGEELRVRVRSASGRHPAPPGGGAPGADLVVPRALDAALLREAPAALSVMTPWHEAATALLDGLPCTTGHGSRTHHVVLTLPYDLEPCTDYLLDVLAVAGSAERRVFRANFTTGRYRTVDELASLVRFAPQRARLVDVPAELHTLPDRPAGDQLDAAFQAAGLPAPAAPRHPLVEVLWSGEAVPQPIALVIESSEALWRERPMPAVAPNPPDRGDPAHTWWRAQPAAWLAPAASATPAAAGDRPRAAIARIVRAPGDARAVVLLAPNQRGAEVRLDLVVAAEPLTGAAARPVELLRLPCMRAPWEMED